MLWALHGAFGSPDEWKGIECKSPIRAPSLWEQVADFSEWTEAFVQEVARRDSTPTLMGYSMGGRLALQALVHSPALWKKAVILSAHPGIEDEEEREKRRNTDRVWAERVRREPLASVISAWNTQPILAGEPGIQDLFYLERHREAIARSFEVWSLGVQTPLWERLKQVHCPVIWITGSLDTRFTKLAKRAVSLLPCARRIELPGCGHRVLPSCAHRLFLL